MTDTHPQVATVPENAQLYAIQEQQQSRTQEIATEPASEVTAAPEPVAKPELQSVIEADETMAVNTTTDTATTISTSTSPSDIASSSQYNPKPSRLSIAFQRISNGCGLCFHPLRNNSPTDYHALVVTPSDEDVPLPGQDYDHHTYGSEPVPITEDAKGDLHHQHQHDGVLGASSSMDHHLLSAQGAEKERTNESQEMSKVATSTEYDEITVEPQQILVEEIVVLDKSLQESSPLDTQQQQQAATPVPEVATVASKTVETPAMLLSSPPTSPTQTRSSPFAKFAKRSSSMSSPSSPSSPPSSVQSSPLLGRLGRFTKKIRSNETTTSDSPLSKTRSKRQSKIESSSAQANTPVVRTQEQEQVVPSVENIATATAFSAAPTPEDLTPVKQAPQNVHVEVQETVLSDDDDENGDVNNGDNGGGKTAIQQEAWSEMPPLPTFQQQQQRMKHNRRGSLALDSAILQTLPVAIPGQSQSLASTPKSPTQSNLAHPHTWTPSESTTLHTADASTSSGQTLSLLTKTTRASTMDSSEVGSVNSRTSAGNDRANDGQKDIDGKKRKKSVLKKFSKMINNINKDGKPDKKERRVSQQESLLMESPIEADEHENSLKN